VRGSLRRRIGRIDGMQRMSNYRMRALATAFAISIVLFSAIAIFGCRAVKTPEQDPNAYVAVDLTNWRVPDKAAEQRVQLALSKWQNGVIDREPILLTAILTKAQGARVPEVVLIAYDEDKDLLGIGVMERHKDGTERSEEYPVYVHARPSRVRDGRWVPVYLRDEGQQKEKSRWEEYVRGDRIDEWSLRHVDRYYQDTMPRVYVSLPDPNKVDILVYLYDRRGNKSSLVELTNRLNVHNPDDDVPHIVGLRRRINTGR
jgi:hypothetical protein